MRLKPEKIQLLGRKVTESILKLKQCEAKVPAEKIAGSVARVIQFDLQREDALEKEAEAILQQHKLAINRTNLSYNTLMTKTKQQLAKDKKIVL